MNSIALYLAEGQPFPHDYTLVDTESKVKSCV
jgi:hypothetical protein